MKKLLKTVSILLVFANISPAKLSKEECSVSGKCLNSQFIKHFVSDDEPKCLVECKKTPNCHWYSYNPNAKLCELFEDCETLTTEGTFDTFFSCI